jgi:hypothetical protein
MGLADAIRHDDDITSWQMAVQDKFARVSDEAAADRPVG